MKTSTRLYPAVESKHRPTGKSIFLRTKGVSQKGTAEDLIGGIDAEWAACQSRGTGGNLPYEERSQAGSRQVVGRDKGTAEQDTSYERESGLEIMSGYEARDLSRKKKEAREHNVEQEVSNNMAFSIHTPARTPTPQVSSPPTNKSATATSWKVYSRTRRCQKQVKEGWANSEAQHIGPTLHKTSIQQQQNKISPQQQQLLDSDKEGLRIQHNTGYRGETTNQDVVEETSLGENKTQEATEIWELAKQLGAIGVEDQGRMVEKIMIMEDRDRKEAEKKNIQQGEKTSNSILGGATDI